MTKKICRTCLKTTFESFRTFETITFFDETEQLKISDVLRYLIPELYLGVTTNPEICAECKGLLKSAYSFKKKCLETENLIGTYLKTARCTARSIDLEDVIEFLEKQKRPEFINAQNIISDWDDEGSEESAEQGNPGQLINSQINKFKEQTLIAEEHVKNSTHSNNENTSSLSQIRVRTNLFTIDNVYSLYQEKDANDSNYQNQETVPEKSIDFEKPPITKNQHQALKKLLEKPKLSLPRTEDDDGNPIVGTGPFRVPSEDLSNLVEVPLIIPPSKPTENPKIKITPLRHAPTPLDEQIEIKEEPLEIDSNEEIGDLNYFSQDEDTLTAPESASFDELQGLITNLEETYDNTNHYVDVPEFVQINNFSLNDLQELQKKPEKPKPEPQLMFVPISSSQIQVSQSSNTHPLILSRPILPASTATSFTIQDLLSNPNVVPSASPPLFVLSQSNQVTQTETKNVIKPIRRRRRALKIVPVGETEGNPVLEKKNTDVDKDICVLFTNYTTDGVYINDHDYLSAPYKRNKVLVKDKNDDWVCICYICGMKHLVADHVDHMLTHDSLCRVCKTCLGTSFMLNMHMRSHSKPCKLCTERVQFSDLERHELKHLEEDKEYETKKERKQYGSKRRRRLDKDEKPVYFAIRPGGDSEQDSSESPRLRRSSEKKSDEDSEKLRPNILVKRRRKRRKNIEETEASPEPESISEKRVLRSTLKKLDSSNESEKDSPSVEG